MAKSHRSESTSTSSSTATSDVATTSAPDFGSNTANAADVGPSAGPATDTLDLVSTEGLVFEEPKSGARYATRADACYTCVVPPPDAPDLANTVVSQGMAPYPDALQAHVDVVAGVEKKKVELQSLVAQGPGRSDVATQMYDILASEKSALCAELVAFLDANGAMGPMLQGCPADLLWDEANVGDTFRLLSYRGDAANLADVDMLTRRKGGGVKRKVDVDDAILANELMDVVSKEGKKAHKHEIATSGSKKDQKALKKIPKTIKRSTQDVDEEVYGSKPLGTRFVGAVEDEQGVSNRDKLLQQLDDPALWAPGSEAQLENTLRMVLASGHRSLALDKSEAHASTAAHHEVLFAVGLVSADGVFQATPQASGDGPRGAIVESVDFMRKTKKGGGHTKVNIFTKRADLKNARLDELQDVTGGSLGGVTFEESDGETNLMDMQADIKAGTFSMSAAHLAIAEIDTPIVKSGPSSILGFRVDATMPTKRDPQAPLRAAIDYDQFTASNVVLQLPERMISIGSLEVGRTSIVSTVLRELSDAEQEALLVALGASGMDGEVPKRIAVGETFGPSIKKMFKALADVFSADGTALENDISIDGIVAKNITTSCGTHQDSAELSGIDYGIDLTNLTADEKLVDLEVDLAEASGPLDVDTPKLRLNGPELGIESLRASVQLELVRAKYDRFIPKLVHLRSVKIGKLSGQDALLSMPSGLQARFPSIALHDLQAGGIQLPGRGQEISIEQAFGDAQASLGMLEIASTVQNELGSSLEGGGVLSLTGLSVASLDSKGVAFSLDDLNVTEGMLSGPLPGPLAALRNLGVDLHYAGAQGLSGEIVQTEDGFKADVTLDSVGATGSGSADDANADAAAHAQGTRVQIEQSGDTTRMNIGLEEIGASANLDAPALALDGQLALRGIEAAVSVVDGTVTIDTFQLARIDGAPTRLTLKQKGLEIDFPTLAVDDVFAKGVTLPGEGESFDLSKLMSGAEAGIGGVEITGGVKDVLHNRFQAGGTFRLNDLAVGGLDSGGVGFSLQELALVDAHAQGTGHPLLAKLGKKGAQVKWAGVSDLSGEVAVGPDGVSGNVEAGTIGADGVSINGRENSALVHDASLDFDLGPDEQAFGLDIGKIATKANFDSAKLGVSGQLDVVGVHANVTVNVKDKSLFIRSLGLQTIDGRGTRVDLKPKGLKLAFPRVRMDDVSASGIQLPGKGKKLALNEVLGANGQASIGSADLRGGVSSSLKQSFTAGGHFKLDDLSVSGLEAGGIGFHLGELSANDVDVQASKLGKLGKVGVGIERVGIDGLNGTLQQGEDGLVVDGSVERVGVDGAVIEAGNTTVTADANASGSFQVDPDNIAIQGTAGASVSVEGGGPLPGAPSSQIGGHAAKPAKNPKFQWSLPLLDTLTGRMGIVLPFGSKRLPLTGIVTNGALDTGAMCENLAVDAIDYVKARLPTVPEWLQFDLLKKAGTAIENAIREGARSVGDALAGQLPTIRPKVEDLLNSPKGPKGAKEPLDLSKYIGGMEGFDLEDQVRGALDVVAEDAVGWLGGASSTVDFAKDGFGTGTYNTAKAVWYKWVAPAAQYVTPEKWQDDLKVSDKKIDQHTDWKKVKDEERAAYLSQAMFDLIEGAADWAGDIGLDLDLAGDGAMFADEKGSGNRAIDLEAALTIAGAGTVQHGADLGIGLASHGDARFGKLDASGWFTVGTGVGGEVDNWSGSGHGNLNVAAGGSVNIAR